MRISRLALSLLLAPAASAGVIVVDSDNGPGTDFTDLNAAIAAASDGDVLLLRGLFDGNFTVAGKALTLLADTSGATVCDTSFGNPSVVALHVVSTSSGVSLVSGLSVSTPVGGGMPMVVDGPAGAQQVVLNGLNIVSADTAGLWLGNASPMTLAHCNVNGGDAKLDGAALPVPGAPAVRAEGAALAVYGGFFTGGDGLAAGVYGGFPIPGQDGQAGLQVHSGDPGLKLLANGTFIGGLGGAGSDALGCLSPGDGGFGVHSSLGSSVKVLGIGGVGNFGGTAAPGCGANGPFGGLLGSFLPGQTPTWQNGNGTRVQATRVVREGGTITVSLQDLPENKVALMVGTELQFSTLPKFSGVMLVKPLFTVDVPMGPPPGTVVLTEHVPELGPGVESMTLYIQAVSKTWQNFKVFGDVTSTVLLDSQF